MKTSGRQFRKLLFGPETLSALSRNGPEICSLPERPFLNSCRFNRRMTWLVSYMLSCCVIGEWNTKMWFYQEADNCKLPTVRMIIVWSLSKDDGYGNKNVSPKYNLALSQVFRDYSVLFTLYNTGELSYTWMGTNGFKVKTENDRFIVIYSVYMLTLSSKPKIWWFHVVVLWSTAKKCTEIRVARAARAFFLF